MKRIPLAALVAAITVICFAPAALAKGKKDKNKTPPAAPDVAFQNADSDKNGQLSKEEFFASDACKLNKDLKKEVDRQNLFATFDTDKSGSISKDEYLAGTSKK